MNKRELIERLAPLPDDAIVYRDHEWRASPCDTVASAWCVTHHGEPLPDTFPTKEIAEEWIRCQGVIGMAAEPAVVVS